VLETSKDHEHLQRMRDPGISDIQLTIDIEEEDNQGRISEQMVRSVEHYSSETIVVVHAKLRKAPKRINNVTIHDYELEVYEIHKVGDLTEHVPFTVYDAENINRDVDDSEGEEDEVSLFPRSSSENTPRASQEVSRPSQKEPANARHSHDATHTSQNASRGMFCPSI
jgi:hypothetical protein